MPRTRSTPVADPDVETTDWTATYEDVGGDGAAFLDPNEIGIDPLPDEVRTQFDAATFAVGALLGMKALGTDKTYTVTLEGTASPGHQSPDDKLSIKVERTDVPLSVEVVPDPKDTVYVATRYQEGAGEAITDPDQILGTP